MILHLYVYVAANDRFSGFSIDLMEKIAEILNITSYQFVEVKEGSKRLPDGTYSGIVGGLMTRVSSVVIRLGGNHKLELCTHVL